MGLPTWDTLLSPSAPPIRLVACPQGEIDEFVYRNAVVTPRGGGVVRIVRGERCAVRERLFQEWAAALQFPYYFGNNWDALDECLADLAWLPASGYLLFATNVEAILPGQGSELSILISILYKVAREWANPVEQASPGRRSAVPFRVVFHADPNKQALGERRLREAGAKLDL
jgi:hypothetical protein